MSRNVIEVRDLGKRYQLGESSLGWWLKEKKEFWALKDISFDLQEGEAVGIIGNNGAGKSTLLKILSRITLPSVGSVKIRGKVRTILEVGIGFQAELTGRENIYLNGALLGMTSKEVKQKFDEIVAFSETEKFLDTPVKRYSSGMYVRLAFAVAAHLNPDILIIDEVLAVGDIAFQRKCLEKLEQASSQHGRTILFVSHNLTAIRSFCKRALFLKEGKLVHDGTVDEVITHFLSAQKNTLDLSTKNLGDRLNRTSGKARFTHIQVKNHLNEKTWSFKTGELIYIELNYTTFEYIEGLTLILHIRSPDKKTITTLKQPIGQDKTIRIKIPNLPLRDGEYGLYACLGDAQGHYHDVIDEAILPYIMVSSEEEDLELKRGFFSIDYQIDPV